MAMTKTGETVHYQYKIKVYFQTQHNLTKPPTKTPKSVDACKGANE
jgi:hypothetical protein